MSMKTFKIIIYYVATGLLGLVFPAVIDSFPQISLDNAIYVALPSTFVLILFLIRNYPKRE